MNTLLELLEQDCTQSAAQLAAQAGMTEEQVKAEMARLEQDGTILGYQAIIDWDRVKRENVTALGIREEQVRPAETGEENTVECALVRLVEDVSMTTVLLRPLDAGPGAPLLRMAMEKGTVLTVGETLQVVLPPEDLMLLE